MNRSVDIDSLGCSLIITRDLLYMLNHEFMKTACEQIKAEFYDLPWTFEKHKHLYTLVRLYPYITSITLAIENRIERDVEMVEQLTNTK